jgi:hypothetical protein
MYGSTINGTLAFNSESDQNSDLDLTIINKENEDEKQVLSDLEK